MKRPNDSPTQRSKSSGFTLMEMIVTVHVVIGLAASTYTFVREVNNHSQEAKRLSNMRQAASYLLAKASDMNGQCVYYWGGATGGFDKRPYNIVRNAQNPNTTSQGVCEIMHWDSKLLAPKNPHWECYAVNFQDVPDVAIWTQEKRKLATGEIYHVKYIWTSSIAAPSQYPLLIDSSTASGKEIFRIYENHGECAALRNSGRANAIMFDGSGKSMDSNDLKSAGFTKAYDTRTNPPKLINL